MKIQPNYTMSYNNKKTNLNQNNKNYMPLASNPNEVAFEGVFKNWFLGVTTLLLTAFPSLAKAQDTINQTIANPNTTKWFEQTVNKASDIIVDTSKKVVNESKVATFTKDTIETIKKEIKVANKDSLASKTEKLAKDSINIKLGNYKIFESNDKWFVRVQKIDNQYKLSLITSTPIYKKGKIVGSTEINHGFLSQIDFQNLHNVKPGNENEARFGTYITDDTRWGFANIFTGEKKTIVKGKQGEGLSPKLQDLLTNLEKYNSNPDELKMGSFENRHWDPKTKTGSWVNQEFGVGPSGFTLGKNNKDEVEYARYSIKSQDLINDYKDYKNVINNAQSSANNPVKENNLIQRAASITTDSIQPGKYQIFSSNSSYFVNVRYIDNMPEITLCQKTKKGTKVLGNLEEVNFKDLGEVPESPSNIQNPTVNAVLFGVFKNLKGMSYSTDGIIKIVVPGKSSEKLTPEFEKLMQALSNIDTSKTKLINPTKEGNELFTLGGAGFNIGKDSKGQIVDVYGGFVSTNTADYYNYVKQTPKRHIQNKMDRLGKKYFDKFQISKAEYGRKYQKLQTKVK